MGYAASVDYDGGTLTDALPGFDPDLSAWRPIGQIDLSDGTYLLFPGEPDWERGP